MTEGTIERTVKYLIAGIFSFIIVVIGVITLVSSLVFNHNNLLIISFTFIIPGVAGFIASEKKLREIDNIVK